MVDYKIEAAPTARSLGVDAAPDDPSSWMGFRVIQSVPGSPHMIIDVPDTAAEFERLAALQEQGVVIDYRPAHSDYRVTGFIPVVPADVAAQVTVGDTFVLVGGTEEIRRLGQYGAPTRLGHVDTPVDARHPVFANKSLTRARAIDPGQGDEHGSHTLGTAAGAVGIASDAPMFTYPALLGGSGSEAEVGNGIRWCADSGCRVITLSLGGSPSQAIDAATTYARQRGSIVVVAAGNDGGNPTPGSPARAASFIVMACDRNLVHASFTDGRNWTLPRRYYSQGVTVVAPFPGGLYGIMSGTSMACPHLAALICLLLSANPGWSEQNVADYLDQHLLSVV